MKFYVLLNIVYFESESAYLWHYRINNFISREFAFNRFKINFGLGQTLLTLLTLSDRLYVGTVILHSGLLSIRRIDCFFVVLKNHSWIDSIELGAKIFHVIIR